MNQQLAQVALFSRRHPQARKPVLHQQPQNMSRIAPVGLLPANIAGPYLRRIPHPHLVAQPLQQIDKPLTVAAGLKAHKRPRPQAPIEPLGLPVTVAQLVLSYLSGLRIENRYLLPTRMKITSYNLHGRLLLIFELVVLNPLATRSSLKPSSLSHQPLNRFVIQGWETANLNPHTSKGARLQFLLRIFESSRRISR